MAATTNSVSFEPPSLAGAVQETVTDASLFSAAETPVGAPGADDAETDGESGDAGPDPCELVALTWNAYVSLPLRPVTCADVALPVALATVPAALESVSLTALTV